jgi:hypothetical protein
LTHWAGFWDIFVMMTPEQAADLPVTSAEKRVWFRQASVQNLWMFIHLTAYQPIHAKEHELARLAIDIRLAEDAAQTAEKIAGQTERLASKVGDLVTISDEQKKLAAKLEIQTDKLIKLTKAIIAFTVVLVAVAFVQVYLMMKEDSIAHVQNVQPRQTEQAGATNK